MNNPPDILLFFGRFHPVLVHLPIGLILLLAALEVLSRIPRFKQANSNTGIILALAAPLAIGVAVCGWLLSLSGGYAADLLAWHKWTGIATAGMCLIAALLYGLHWHKAYRACLLLSVGVLAVASHFGGSLTHGSDYLVHYAPGPLRAWLGHPAKTVAGPAKGQDPMVLPAFAGLIQPILQKDCVSCHGPEKLKGGLRLDSLDGLRKGGKSGPVLSTKQGEQSELGRRIEVAVEDQDHMPPEGTSQPSPDDIALLQWWLKAGAPTDKRIGELNPPAAITRLLATRFGGPAPVAVLPKTAPPKPLNVVAPIAAQVADELHVVVTPLSQQEPWLQCTASVAGTNFGDAELSKLAPLATNLRWLDLAGTRVTDGGLAGLAAMGNLTRLHLERTGVTDSGLTNLANLASLEFLDLYATEVTDAGLASLTGLPKLKRLFLWQTKVTPTAAKDFAQSHSGLDQVKRWRDEIEQLKTKIKGQEMLVDTGIALAAAGGTNAATGATNAVAINTVCPVSGKSINPAKTVLYEGKLVAFCCDDCKAKFEQDPKPFLEKLGLVAGKGTAASKP